MVTIKVVDICDMAFAENDGLKLRFKMQELLNSNESIEIDFTGITIYTSAFFNVSIGYFISNKGLDYCNKKIIVSNLNNLGVDTFNHFYNNAIALFNMTEDDDTVVENNINAISILL